MAPIQVDRMVHTCYEANRLQEMVERGVLMPHVDNVCWGTEKFYRPEFVVWTTQKPEWATHAVEVPA